MQYESALQALGRGVLHATSRQLRMRMFIVADHWQAASATHVGWLPYLKTGRSTWSSAASCRRRTASGRCSETHPTARRPRWRAGSLQAAAVVDHSQSGCAEARRGAAITAASGLAESSNRAIEKMCLLQVFSRWPES
jgi:hypothetical protein